MIQSPTFPRLLVLCSALLFSACGGRSEVSRAGGYNLDITHPAPHATFLRIAPADGAARFPSPRQIESRHFSQYLRARTGCVVNPSYPVTVLGHHRMPAAYVVPITCR